MLEFDGVKTGRDVRSEIFRARDFVEQLRRNGSDRNFATGAFVFAKHGGTVLGNFGPGKPDPAHAGDFMEKRVVAPRGLGPALDHVASGHRARQCVPVVSLPPVVPGRRPTNDSGVGGAPGDDDVGPVVEGLHDAPAAKVGVRREKRGRVLDGLSRFEMAELIRGDQILDVGNEVIAAHVRDLRRKAKFRCRLGHGIGASVGVESARVRNDLDATVEARAHHLLHLGDEGAGIAATGPLGPGSRENEHRQLGEPVAGEHVDRPVFDHLAGRREAIPEESRAVGNADRIGHGAASSVGTSRYESVLVSTATSRVPDSTCWPISTRISVTTPSSGASIGCSIFMASRTATVWPARTGSPTATWS